MTKLISLLLLVYKRIIVPAKKYPRKKFLQFCWTNEPCNVTFSDLFGLIRRCKMHFIAPGGRTGTTLISHHLHLRQLVAQDQPIFLFSILKVHALESKINTLTMINYELSGYF